MKGLVKLLTLGLIASGFCSTSHAMVSFPADSESDYSDVGINASSTPSDSKQLVDDSDVWKYRRKILVGFSTGTLDQKRRFGGEISSRWGISLTFGRNIYLHRKAIGGFLKFGLNIDINCNYLNFAKGTGDISHIFDSMSDEDSNEVISLGRHYITAGLALGPTATFAPFYASDNRNLASLKFRPYFHVVPSYATYLISDNDDIELHNAFALWYAAGLEIQWKRLIAAVEWKGSTAKYKGAIEDLVSEIGGGNETVGSHKFDTNFLTFSIGLAF